MVEHGDFFDHAPWLVVGHDHAHDAEPPGARARRHGRYDEIRRRAVRRAEMMLAEEDAFEAPTFELLPEVEIPVVMLGRRLRRHVDARRTGRDEELEEPRLDHCSLPAERFCGAFFCDAFSGRRTPRRTGFASPSTSARPPSASNRSPALGSNPLRCW